MDPVSVPQQRRIMVKPFQELMTIGEGQPMANFLMVSSVLHIYIERGTIFCILCFCPLHRLPASCEMANDPWSHFRKSQAMQLLALRSW